ncbi:MAG TPA: hypothetical protein VGK38_01650, partial [Prolixibacteraceae bacterium]
MKITRSKYESFFLDFLEGNLDASLMDEFRLFLKENPDLALELEMGDIPPLLTNQDIRFEAKEELKKSVSDQGPEFQERAVAYYEGDLSISEQKDFEASLSENSAIATEAQQFGKLKLLADPAIVFENKELLKKRGVLIPLWIKVASAAAMLILAYLLFRPYDSIQTKPAQIAGNFGNKPAANIVVPEIKEQLQEKEKNPPATTPKQTPSTAPVKQKPNTVAPKQEKKVAPPPQLRAPVAEPSLLKPRVIYIGQSDNVELAAVNIKEPTLTSKDMELADLLKVQLAAMRKSDDREFLSTDHLGLSGLQLVARLTGKRLTARKGDDGAV